MGRRKKQKPRATTVARKKRDADGYDSDDSLQTNMEEWDQDVDVSSWNDSFTHALTDMEETRRETRIMALAGMARVLARSCQTDIVSDSLDTLLDSCIRRLRYGDEAERVAASVVLNRVIVTVGPNRQDAYEALSGILETIFLDEATSASAVAATIHTYALACFVWATEDLSTHAALAVLGEQMETDRPATIRAAAIRSWVFVLTTCGSSHVASSVFHRAMPILENAMVDDDYSVRRAAGSAIGVLWNMAEDAANNGGGDSVADDYDTERLIDTLQELSSENNRFIAKKERSSNRQFFKSVKATVEDGESPEEFIKAGGYKIVFTDWVEVMQSRMFRRVLGGGLLVHFASNDLMSDIFTHREMALELEDLSQIEKRHLMSPNSARVRDRHAFRSGARDNKRAMQRGEDDDY